MKRFCICIFAAVSTFIAGPAPADEALAKQIGCLECHGVDKKIIGPAFRDIAGKYKGDPGARGALIKTVKVGGKGNWTEMTGGVPMPPFSGLLSNSEVERLVDWVLAR